MVEKRTLRILEGLAYTGAIMLAAAWLTDPVKLRLFMAMGAVLCVVALVRLLVVHAGLHAGEQGVEQQRESSEREAGEEETVQ